MKDYGVSVLEQYEMEVFSTRRIRGAVLCDTDRGVFLLKETRVAKGRLPVLLSVYELLGENGLELADAPLANREGEYVSCAEDGTFYMVKRWFCGRECDIRREAELLEGVRLLANLHRILRFPGRSDAEAEKRESLKEEYERHNRELRKVRSFVRKRSVKGEFETVFLQGFEKMYLPASLAAKRLEGEGIAQLYEEFQREGTFIHGDYNYHNLMICPQGMAVTGFERTHQDVQMADFYYFLRKTMEKYHYDERLGYRMMRAYDDVLTLDRPKRDYLAVRLAYPEKFWKIVNMYYHSNKAWIPAKNVEKLRNSIAQSEEKRRFLENLFSFSI
ncbi:phosphotransferase [Roseburia hominis]